MSGSKLERPVLAVDVVLFRIQSGKLQVLLSRRESGPFEAAFALPGVGVRIDESLEDAALRALLKKAQLPRDFVDDIYWEQLSAFDALYRDPRGRTVSVAHLGIVRKESEFPESIQWRAVTRDGPGELPFDHVKIVETGKKRLEGKLRYTNIASRFLPEVFRIEQLQSVYEAILCRSLNRTNFRNKLLKIELIERVGILTEAVGRKGGRPPHLYRFVQDTIKAQNRDFLA